MFGPGLFGSTFDFNRDGEMEPFERAAECAFLHDIMQEEERIEMLEDAGLDPDDFDF